MKKICCLFLFFLLSSYTWGLNVELNINTSSMEIQNGAIIDTNTLNVTEVKSPILLETTKNKLFYTHNGNIISSDSFIINDENNIVFKANHKIYNYRGSLKIHSQAGKIKFLNIVDLEDYVEGVLRGEFLKNAPVESIKAQAICIRTFALNKMNAKNYHLCDTHCQHYIGNNEIEIFRKAAKDTKGYVLKYNGALISAMYSTHCGGWTSSWNKAYNTNKFPYLASSHDVYHSDLKNWTYKISLNDLSKKIKLDNIKDIKIKSEYNNRVLEIEFIGDNNKIFQGEKFRPLLGNGNIKSTLFNVEIKDGYAVFSGTGYGHGYGFCQLGAIEMARQGFSCRDILKFYYKGCEIVKE